MLYRVRQQRAKTSGVRRATSSAFKGINVCQVATRCYSSESHNLTAGWATRPPWRVFNSVFVAHGRKAVLKPQRGTKAERRKRQCQCQCQCLRKLPPSQCPRWKLRVVGGNSRGAPNPRSSSAGAIGRRPSWTRNWQALDPAAIAARGANAFWQKRCVNAVTAW